MEEFDNYLNKNNITYEITTFCLFAQNGKAKRVNSTIMSLV